MTRPVCLITGVGPGTGTALVKRFSAQYQVAMVARSEVRLAELGAELDQVQGFVCDVSDAEAIKLMLAEVREKLGAPEVLIHNAVSGSFADILSVKPEDLARNFEVNTMALLHLIQGTATAMVEAGKGVIMATGNTSAYIAGGDG